RLLRAGLSCLVPQVRLADADDVAWHQLVRAAEACSVHVRAVRRADVLDPDTVAPRLDTRVAAGRELVVREGDVVRRGAADGDGLRVQVEARTTLDRRAANGDERARVDRLRLPSQPVGGRLRRAHDEALLRHAHLARGAAHDPPDEEVE